MRSSLASAALLLALAGCSASLGDGPGADAGGGADAPESVPDAPEVDPPDAAPDPPDALILPACTEGAMRVLGGPENSCYMLFTGALQYTQARDACAALDPPAHLAVVSSLEENQFFAPLANRTPPDHLIGGNDLLNEGTFVWITGDPMAFTYWRQDPLEPNDGGDGPAGTAEDCMIVEGDTGATWDDRPCTTGFPYICERDAP